MPQRAFYSDEQRAEALRLYEEVGPAEASRRCGVPNATIRSWASRAGLGNSGEPKTLPARQRALERWETRRLTAADEFGDAAAQMREHALKAAKAKDEKMLRASAVAAGIFTDKAQLLSGNPTERLDWAKQATSDERAQRLAGLVDELAKRREAKAAEQ